MPSITIAKNQEQQVEVGSVDASGRRTNDPVSNAVVTSGDTTKLQVETMIESGAVVLVPQNVPGGAAVGDTVTVSVTATVTVNGVQTSFSSTVTVTIAADATPPDPTTGIDLFPVGPPTFQ